MRNLMMSIGMLVLFALLSACGAEDSVVEQRLRPVQYLTVGAPEAFRTRTFSGSSKSAQESKLSFKVSGTVVDIPVQVGDKTEIPGVINELFKIL